ncbi:MAG TPA: glycine cleavage system aminomethyltransferase GcvT [Candidatus Omnitrophota bacterium]|nr:glycine cleavage system aminomethyltransferase GcvT [Candidatus Omnitrophota bacterium]
MSSISDSVRRLPLHARHVEKNARIGQFGNWEVPLYYTTIIQEHHLVRQKAGLFDISHMGEFFVSGPTACDYLNKILPRSIEKMLPGQAWYMPLLNDQGGLVDDIIVYAKAHNDYLVIVNAGNVDKDRKWFEDHLIPGVNFKDRSDEFGLLAIQGPASAVIMEAAFGQFYTGLKNYSFAAFGEGMIARTGYTGEDGFEIMVPTAKLDEIWQVLMRAGAKHGLEPVGFGARDTLRLEAAMPLYGHELSDEISPVEAGLSMFIDWTKTGDTSRANMNAVKQSGPQRKRVGFELVGRGIAREGAEVTVNGQKCGWVTSGAPSPTLGKTIGMAYVSADLAVLGGAIDIVIRGTPVPAKIVKLPFYKRK